MYSSSYYKQKISDLESLKSQISALLPKVNSCDSVLTKSQKYIDEITINGETIDQGKLKDVSSKLADADSDLNAIISECNQKISDYKISLREALAREEAARQAEERKRRAATAKGNTTSIRERI